MAPLTKASIAEEHPSFYYRDLVQVGSGKQTDHLREISRTSVILDNNVFSYEVIASNPGRVFIIPAVILDEKDGGLPLIYKKIKKTGHPKVFTIIPVRSNSHWNPSIAGLEIQRISKSTRAPTSKTPPELFQQRINKQRINFLNYANRYGDVSDPDDRGNKEKLEADFAKLFDQYKAGTRSDAIIQQLASLTYIRVIFAMTPEERKTERSEFEKSDSKILNDTTLIVHCLMLGCGIYSNDRKVKDMAYLCEVPFYNEYRECENFPEIEALNE